MSGFYFGPDNALHLHPEPVPNLRWSDAFFDPKGNVVLINLRDHTGQVFDTTLGHFRPFRQTDVPHSVADPDAEMLQEGPKTPISNARPGLRIIHPESPGQVTTNWRVLPGKLGVELSWTDGELVAISAKGRRILDVPGGGRRLSAAFELAEPGRVVLVFEGPSVVTVDAELAVREVPGSWRLQGNLNSYPARGRDEALLVDRYGVFRLVNKPLSGAALCSTADAPPVAAVALRPLDEITAFLLEEYAHRPLQAVSAGGDIYLNTGRRLIRLPASEASDLAVLGAETCLADLSTCAWDTGQFNWGMSVIPGTRSLLLAGNDGFQVFDTETAEIIRYAEPRHCCKEIAPLGVNPASGAILLSDGRMLRPDGTIAAADLPRFSPGTFTAFAAPSWLTTPLFGLFQWQADNRFVPLDPSRPDLDRSDGLRTRWLDLERFGFLATEFRGGWQLIGPDLVLHEMPGSTREPGSGLPNPGLGVLTPVYDPGAGDVLVGQFLYHTMQGLWGIGREGSLHRIACADDCRTGAITAIVADPGAPHAALVGAEAGLFNYDADGDAWLHQAVPIAVTGSITHLLPIPWKDAVLVFGTFGTFFYRDGGTLVILPETLWHDRLVVLPDVRTILSAGVPPVVIEFPDD